MLELLARAATDWRNKSTFLSMFRVKTARSTWERRTWRLSRAPAWCLLMSFLAVLLAAPASFVPYKAQMPMSWWCAEHLTKMAAAKRSKPSKAKSPKRAPTPSGKGFTVQTMEPKVETKTGKASKKSKVQKAKVPEQMVPEAKPAEKVELDPNESEEDREFRERYLSAEKEDQPDWKEQMDAAKTTEDRFKVGLKVGDFKTSYSILAEELLASFADGDKERLDNFLTKVGISSWQLALIQLIVIGVPLAGVTYVTGLWKWPAWAVCKCQNCSKRWSKKPLRWMTATVNPQIQKVWTAQKGVRFWHSDGVKDFPFQVLCFRICSVNTWTSTWSTGRSPGSTWKLTRSVVAGVAVALPLSLWG